MSFTRLPKLTTHRPSPTAHLRQRTFPPRTHLSFPSTKSSLRNSRRVAQQSTLTQMDFVTASFEASDGEEAADFEEQQPRKRRKMARTVREVEELRQATLTQIRWAGAVGDSERDEEEGIDGGGDSWVVDRSETDMMDEGIVEDEERLDDGRDGRQQHNLKRSSPPKNALSPDPHRSTNHLQPASTSEAAPAHSTPPRHQMKREIPSSQSPSTTPLSTPTRSPTKRTPLSEIPQNIWAQRDEEATPSQKPTTTPHKRTGKNKQIPDSDSEMEMEEGEDDSEDKENLNRSTRNSPSKNPSKSPFPNKEPATTPSTPRKSWRRTKSTSTSTSTSNSPSTNTNTNTNTNTMPPPPRSQPMSSPASLTIPPRPGTPALTPQSDDTLRSSQATTMSLTQNSLAASPLRRMETGGGEDCMWSDLQVSGTEPEAFESQFPYSAYSVLEWEWEGEGEGEGDAG